MLENNTFLTSLYKTYSPWQLQNFSYYVLLAFIIFIYASNFMTNAWKAQNGLCAIGN